GGQEEEYRRLRHCCLLRLGWAQSIITPAGAPQVRQGITALRQADHETGGGRRQDAARRANQCGAASASAVRRFPARRVPLIPSPRRSNVSLWARLGPPAMSALALLSGE